MSWLELHVSWDWYMAARVKQTSTSSMVELYVQTYRPFPGTTSALIYCGSRLTVA